MGILNLKKLLSPVTDEAPCGDDLSDLTEYYVLEEYARGKEETQFSEAEPPDWQQVEKLAQDLLLQGKEMWVISHLICAMTANHGIRGLNEGVRFLFEMVSAFWEHLFPEPDSDDANPYEQRMNVLNSLSDSSSSLMENIRRMPICRSRQLGEFSLRDILLARGEITGDDPPDRTMIEAAARDTDPEFMDDTISLVKDTMDHIRRVDDFIVQEIGRENNTSNMLKIQAVLQAILDFMAPYSGDRGADDGGKQDRGGGIDQVSDKIEGPSQKEVQPDKTMMSGVLSSREDVNGLLGEIIGWYDKNEPASPVAMIVERAKSLVGKNFFQITAGILGPDTPQIPALFGTPEAHPIPDSTPGSTPMHFNIKSRQDILDWLDKASIWYYANEPSSPVPLFLHRARQLVGKNFQQIISEIADQAQEQVTDLLKNR